MVQALWMMNVSPLVKLAGCVPVPLFADHQLATVVAARVPLVGEYQVAACAACGARTTAHRTSAASNGWKLLPAKRANRRVREDLRITALVWFEFIIGFTGFSL